MEVALAIFTVTLVGAAIEGTGPSHDTQVNLIIPITNIAIFKNTCSLTFGRSKEVETGKKCQHKHF